jgi:membrane associated rhomboid family serine protease
MSAQTSSASAAYEVRPNGAGAAAILAAGLGSFLLAVLAIAADQSAAIKNLMNFSKPTGPLSGVTTCAIVAWLAAWALLHVRWRKRNLALARVSAIAFVLLIFAVLLTFPPIADLF